MSTQAATLDAPAVARPKFRNVLPGAWFLSAAMLASGLLTYAFHVLAARTLGPETYGRIAVLWAALFLTAVVLCRPLEQTTSRALADRLARGEEIATVVRAMAVLCAGTLAAVAVAAVVGRGTIGSRLFEGDEGLAAALLAGIAIYAVAYVLRGVLAGTGWFRGYGIALVGDTAARLALGRANVAAVSWAVAAALFLALYAALPGEELWRISVAFASAAAAGLTLLLGALAVEPRR